MRQMFAAARSRPSVEPVDLANDVAEIVHAIKEAGAPTSIDDPRLDRLTRLIHAASKREGFTVELASQMDEAGLELSAEALTQLAILAAKRR
jgi:hypothetical protein